MLYDFKFCPLCRFVRLCAADENGVGSFFNFALFAQNAETKTGGEKTLECDINFSFRDELLFDGLAQRVGIPRACERYCSIVSLGITLLPLIASHRPSVRIYKIKREALPILFTFHFSLFTAARQCRFTAHTSVGSVRNIRRNVPCFPF